MFRISWFLACIFISTIAFSQSRDTLIILPFSNSAPSSIRYELPIAAVSAGMFHLTVVDQEGQLSTLLDENAYFVIPPVLQDKVRTISTGDIHTVTLYKDSTLGQYFINDHLSMFFPDKLKGIIEVRSGPKMSCALTKKGILYSWGNGSMIKKLNIPLKTYGVKTSSVGKEHIAFINVKNKIFVWGDHSLGQNKKPINYKKPISIACGDYHTLMLDETGSVQVWGNNDLGQCKMPDLQEKVRLITAKNFRSMVATENQKVWIWGMNQTCNFDFSELGEIKQIALGNNFAAIVVSSNNERLVNYYKKNQGFKNVFTNTILTDSSLAKLKSSISDSVLSRFNLIPKENFFQEYLQQNFASKFGTNTIDIQNENVDGHGSSEITFEGENNALTIINENLKVLSEKKVQRVIIKGSNKKAVFYNTGTVNAEGNEPVVIDLDQLGTTNAYPSEYIDQSVGMDMIIEFDSLPNSFISEFPIINGTYTTVLGNHGLAMLCDEVGFWADEFLKAQGYFYCKNNKEAIEILVNADEYLVECKLALFEIYYYGLFGIPVDLKKANQYYAEYKAARIKFGLK